MLAKALPPAIAHRRVYPFGFKNLLNKSKYLLLGSFSAQHACCNCPMRDNSSLLVQARLLRHLSLFWLYAIMH
jgi:hypothetical protein